MKISETGVKKPVMTIMVFLAILILGGVSYFKLAIDMMPEIESPSISVFTQWDGASTEDVETRITRVIESALGSVTDLDEITSTTREGSSRVTCKFKWGTELGEAANDMRDLLERAKRNLPDDAEDPIMFKFNTSNMPIMNFSVTCRENREKMETTVEDYIVDVLKRVPGVGTAEAFGGLTRQINVHLDPDKLSAYGISVIEVAEAIDNDNQTEPAGNIKIGSIDYTIRVPGEFTDPNQVGDVIVKRNGDTVVRLRDVARVEDGFEEEDSVVERNGRRGMMVSVQKRSGENTVAVCRRILDKIEDIKKTLPADYDISVVSDSSDSIIKSIASVGETVIYGGIFVILTTLFFLRSVRASLVITLTIPFSLIIAFVFMFLMGWTINIMSMSALAVAIGMVVDNAVVVLENIFSHIARGTRRREASMFGADEVGTAVIASTLTTIVVFLPLIFVEGVSGIMMKQLGGLITATLCASVMCSLLLTPMLASKLITKESVSTGSRGFKGWSESFFVSVENLYGRILGKSLNKRWTVVAICAAVFGLTIYSATFLGSEFMGTEDTGQLNITFELPLGTRYEKTTEVARRVADVINDVCGKDKITIMTTTTGGSSGGFGGNRASHIGSIRIKLVDSKFRDHTADEYGAEITKRISQWPEITKAYSSSDNFMNRVLRSGGSNLTVDIYGYDLDVTMGIAQQIKAIAQSVSGTRDVRISQDLGLPELSIEVDREKASALGISMYDLTTIISTLFQGNDCSEYREGEDEYDITLRLERINRDKIEDIRRSEIPLPSGDRIRLDTIADVVESTGPVTISRKNQQRIVTVEFDSIGRPQGDIMSEIDKRIQNEVILPSGITVQYGGMIEEQEESERTMTMLIILGVVLVYMVMAGQFESFIHPLLIMFSVPFAFSGVVTGLHITNTPLSMTAYIGIILLVGVVVNNAIVLVDYINLLRLRGIPLFKAIVDSGRQRLRPVLITTSTTLLGMLPMAMSTGDGSATWRPLGIVVVGGLTVSTVVSMIIVPVLYYITESYKERRLARKKTNETARNNQQCVAQ